MLREKHIYTALLNKNIWLLAASLGYPTADVMSAIFVALIMLYISMRLGKDAVFVMLDRAPDGKLIEEISTIISKYPKVDGYHSLRARTVGNRAFVDVSVHLDERLSLGDAHKISNELEKKILEKCPEVKEIVIHLESKSSHD